MTQTLPAADPVDRVSGEQILAWRRRMLRLGGAAAEIDWMLDLAAGLPWTRLQTLRLEPELRLDLKRKLQDLEMLWREHLSTAAPLQYLVGVCAWRDLELSVSPSVLIPRPETEMLVEVVLRLCAAAALPMPLRWADLGTGSGCLAVALARVFPGGRGFATDRSLDALQVAASNLRHPGVPSSVLLRQGDWWEALRSVQAQLSLVVANPPYIPSAELACLDPVVRLHEPLAALEGGDDGLREIRRVVAGAPAGLAPGGLLVLEHHHDQSPAVLELLRKAGLVDVQAHRDLEGVLRFASARRAQARVPGP